jgi:predicted DNA-binding antitoxin AbrB/MazE fold protein
MTVKAIYENGVFKPVEPVNLEEKAEVDLEIRPVSKPPAEDNNDPTGWKAIDRLIGIIKDAPPDVSENHDHYLYGAPSR